MTIIYDNGLIRLELAIDQAVDGISDVQIPSFNPTDHMFTVTLILDDGTNEEQAVAQIKSFLANLFNVDESQVFITVTNSDDTSPTGTPLTLHIIVIGDPPVSSATPLEMSLVGVMILAIFRLLAC